MAALTHDLVFDEAVIVYAVTFLRVGRMAQCFGGMGIVPLANS